MKSALRFTRSLYLPWYVITNVVIKSETVIKQVIEPQSIRIAMEIVELQPESGEIRVA